MMASKQDFLDVIQYMESRGNPNAVSPAGASGTMQTMPATRKAPGFGVMPARDSSIEEGDRVGRDYALALLNHYSNDPSLALAAYNAGPGNVNKYGGVPPFAETQKYVKEGLNYLQGGIDTPEEDDIAEFEKFYAETNPTEKAPDDITQFEDWYARQQSQQPQELPERTAGEYVSDVGTSVEKGILGAGQAVVGLGDLAGMPFGVSPGKYLEEHGYDMAHNQDILSEQYSPQQKEANKKLAEAHGVAENIKAAWENPSAVGTMLGESMPAMVAGGILGRASKVLGVASPYVAAGLGEGVITAGQTAEQLREQAPDKELTGKGALASIGAGVGTGVLGGIGGKLITKIGGIDANLWLSGGAKEIAEQSVGEAAKTPGFFKKALISAFGEGVLEEAPQSAQEQMWQNYATDKPLLEGVEDAAVKGAILGSVMGGGASAVHATLGGAEEEGEPEGKYTPEMWAKYPEYLKNKREEEAKSKVVPPTVSTEGEIPEPTVRTTEAPAMADTLKSWGLNDKNKLYKDLVNVDPDTPEGYKQITKAVEQAASKYTSKGTPLLTASFNHKAFADFKDQQEAKLAEQAANPPEVVEEEPVQKPTAEEQKPTAEEQKLTAEEPVQEQPVAEVNVPSTPPPESAPAEVIPTPVKRVAPSKAKVIAAPASSDNFWSAVENLQKGFSIAQDEYMETYTSKTLPKVKKEFNRIFSPLLSAKEKRALFEYWFEQGELASGDYANNEWVDQAHNNLNKIIENEKPVTSVVVPKKAPVQKQEDEEALAEQPEAKKQPIPKAETPKAETPVVEEKPELTLEDRFEPTDVNLSHIKQFEPGKGLLKEIRSEKGLTIKEVKEKLKTRYREDFLTGLAELNKEKPVMNAATAWASPKRAPVVEEEEVSKKPLEFSDADITDYKKRITEGTLNESETAQAIHSKLKTRNYNLYKKYNAVHENAVSDKEQALKAAQRAAAKNKPKVEAVKKERVRATVQETAKKLEEGANLAKKQEAAAKQEQPAEEVTYTDTSENSQAYYSHESNIASSIADTAGKYFIFRMKDPKKSYDINGFEIEDGASLHIKTINGGRISIVYEGVNPSVSFKRKGDDIPIAYFSKHDNTLADLLNNKYGSKDLNKIIYESFLKAPNERVSYFVGKLGLTKSLILLSNAVDTTLWKKYHPEYGSGVKKEARTEEVLTEQGEDRYSVAPNVRDTGHTIESLSKSLSPELKRLVKSGKVVLHNTADTLPGKAHPANVQGMTTREGVSHYVANKLTPHTLHKVALHEVGVHVGMEKMVGAKVWADIKQQVLTNKGRVFDEARAAVPAGTAENLRAEEALAYLVENSPALPIVRRLISAIRNWARTALGMNINLTENDARHLAERVLRKESKTAQKTANTTDIKYSLSDPDLNARLAEMEADIKKAVAPEASGFRRKLGRIATYMQSDDAWFQMQSAKQLRRLGMPHKMAQDLLLAISKSQAVHYTSVAGAGIEMGDLKFNDDLKMFEGVFNDNNLRSLTSKLTALGEKYNKTADEMKEIYQNVMVARRVKEIRDNALEIMKTADKLSPKLKNQFLSKSHNKSALELAEKIHSITDEQVEKDLNLIKDYPELDAKDGPIKMWDNIRKNAIKTLVDTGYWTEEKATNYINNAAYVPFNRDMSTEEIDVFAEDMQSKPMFGGKGLTRHAKEHKIKGSTREVLPIIENMESWLATAYSKAIKNHKAVQMVDFTFDYMPKGSIVKLADSANKDGAFYIFRKGIKEWYKMEDPLAAAAFIGMPASANGFVKIAAPYARKLRNIIVLNPLFTLAQLPQDTFSAMYTSGLKNPFALPLEVTKEFVKTLAGKSKAHAALKPKGVVGTLDYSDMAVRRDLEASMGLSEGPKTWKDKVMRPLEHFAMIGDNSIRQAVYNRTIKEMGSSPLAERIAVERALEIVNFRRRGASAGVDAWRQVVPFFGAYLQVQSVALKTLSGTGITPTQRSQALKTLAFTTAQVMAMSFLYNALAGGDDEYDKMDPAVRDKKLFVFGADKPFTIPLRQDIFLMPHVVMTHVYDSLLKDVEHPDVARKVIAEALWSSVSGVPTLPTMIRAPLENLTNYDFNTGRPIEGVHLKNIATAYKATPSTSETAKMLGKIEDAILPEKAQISPIKIDHLIQGFFGTAAGVILQATDSALRAGMDIPSTDMSWQDAFRKGPGVSAFIASEKGSRDQAQFYRFKEEVDKAYNTLKSMDTKPKEQEAYYAKHAKLIDVNSAMQAIEQRLSAIRKEQKANADMPNAYRSPEEKRKYKEMLENEIDTTVSGIRQIMDAAYRK